VVVLRNGKLGGVMYPRNGSAILPSRETMDLCDVRFLTRFISAASHAVLSLVACSTAAFSARSAR